MGFPNCKTVQSRKNELTSTTLGVVFRGIRIVIPAALQQHAIDIYIAHETHLGIEKTKSLIREKSDSRKLTTESKTQLLSAPLVKLSDRRILRNARVTMEQCQHRFLWSTISSEYLLMTVERYSTLPAYDILQPSQGYF